MVANWQCNYIFRAKFLNWVPAKTKQVGQVLTKSTCRYSVIFQSFIWFEWGSHKGIFCMPRIHFEPFVTHLYIHNYPSPLFICHVFPEDAVGNMSQIQDLQDHQTSGWLIAIATEHLDLPIWMSKQPTAGHVDSRVVQYSTVQYSTVQYSIVYYSIV